MANTIDESNKATLKELINTFSSNHKLDLRKQVRQWAIEFIGIQISNDEISEDKKQKLNELKKKYETPETAVFIASASNDLFLAIQFDFNQIGLDLGRGYMNYLQSKGYSEQNQYKFDELIDGLIEELDKEKVNAAEFLPKLDAVINDSTCNKKSKYILDDLNTIYSKFKFVSADHNFNKNKEKLEVILKEYQTHLKTEEEKIVSELTTRLPIDQVQAVIKKVENDLEQYHLANTNNWSANQNWSVSYAKETLIGYQELHGGVDDASKAVKAFKNSLDLPTMHDLFFNCGFNINANFSKHLLESARHNNLNPNLLKNYELLINKKEIVDNVEAALKKDNIEQCKTILDKNKDILRERRGSNKFMQAIDFILSKIWKKSPKPFVTGAAFVNNASTMFNKVKNKSSEKTEIKEDEVKNNLSK